VPHASFSLIKPTEESSGAKGVKVALLETDRPEPDRRSVVSQKRGIFVHNWAAAKNFGAPDGILILAGGLESLRSLSAGHPAAGVVVARPGS
jgi:hypothetical protein